MASRLMLWAARAARLALLCLWLAVPALALADSSTVATLYVARSNQLSAAMISTTISPVSATLGGNDVTATFTTPLDLQVANGVTTGWNLTVTSTSWTESSTGHSFPTDATTVTGVTVAAGTGSTPTYPTNSISYPVTVPAGTSAPAAAKFFNAAADTGIGRFTLTPTFSVSVPVNAYAGTYQSTLTLSIAAGP